MRRLTRQRRPVLAPVGTFPVSVSKEVPVMLAVYHTWPDVILGVALLALIAFLAWLMNRD